MKEKRTYKILRIDGIGIEPNSNHNVKYLGKSRIDDYPLFEVEYDPKNSALSVDILRASLKVSGNPGYVIKYSEIQIKQWKPKAGTLINKIEASRTIRQLTKYQNHFSA